MNLYVVQKPGMIQAMSIAVVFAKCDICHQPVSLDDDAVFVLHCGHAIHLNCIPCNQCQGQTNLHAAGMQIPDWANIGARWTFERDDAIRRAVAGWTQSEHLIGTKPEPPHDPKPWVPLPALQPLRMEDVLDSIPLPTDQDTDSGSDNGLPG